MADEITYDVNCDYDQLEALADKVARLAQNQAEGHAKFVSSKLNVSGDWSGKDIFVKVFEEDAADAKKFSAKLAELGDKMKQAAQAMREADTAAQAALDAK